MSDTADFCLCCLLLGDFQGNKTRGGGGKAKGERRNWMPFAEMEFKVFRRASGLAGICGWLRSRSGVLKIPLKLKTDLSVMVYDHYKPGLPITQWFLFLPS